MTEGQEKWEEGRVKDAFGSNTVAHAAFAT